jgi:cytochrome c5
MKQFLVAVIACSLALTASFAFAEQRSGKEIYTAHCAMCHESGVAGAPKAFDKAAWKEHMTGGMEQMLENAEKGIGAMPPKGMCSDCTKEELKGAIEYMTEESK